MQKEDMKKIILSLEGLKRREWDDIKEHVDKQFDWQFFNATKEQVLVADKDLLEDSLDTMRSFIRFGT